MQISHARRFTRFIVIICGTTCLWSGCMRYCRSMIGIHALLQVYDRDTCATAGLWSGYMRYCRSMIGIHALLQVYDRDTCATAGLWSGHMRYCRSMIGIHALLLVYDRDTCVRSCGRAGGKLVGSISNSKICVWMDCPIVSLHVYSIISRKPSLECFRWQKHHIHCN